MSETHSMIYGLALYCGFMHCYLYLRLKDARARVARAEQIFRQMGVVFEEDKVLPARPLPVEGDDD